MIFYGLVWAASVSALVDFSRDMLPVRNGDDAAMRIELASAIVGVTEDDHERRLLMRIARWESQYRRDVATCATVGAAGEVSAWQVLPRSSKERAALCESFEGAAKIALGRVRESLHGCRHLKDASERLSIYARGNCQSPEGRRLSKIRWVSP